MKAEVREIDEVIYSELLLQTNATLFQKTLWLELVVPEGTVMRYFRIHDNGKNLGVLALPFRSGRILKDITGLPHTPHTGPAVFSNSFSNIRLISDAVADYLKNANTDSVHISFSPEFTDFLPFREAGMTVRLKQTYRLDLTLSEADLLANLRSDKQRSIKKAEKKGLHVSFEKDVSVMERLLKKTYGRRNLGNKPISVSLKILETCPDGFQVTVYTEGQPLSSLYIAHDHQTAYYLFGGFDYEQGNHFAGPFAMWQAITAARQRGLKFFDFEGSEIPEIEIYFAAFGATRACYFSVQRKNYKARLLASLL